EKIVAGGSVVDILPDKSSRFARQIGVEGLLQNCGDVPSGFDFIFANRVDSRRPTLLVGPAAPRISQERFLLILSILKLVLFSLALSCPTSGDMRQHRRDGWGC